MSSVDNRVVKMQFDNAQFQAGIRQTLESLASLDKAVKLEGASKGLEGLGTAANNIKLNHLEAGVDAIADKFKAMSVIAITALTNIVNKAVNAGESLIKSLTIDPVKSGLEEYETTLNSIQTILANTGLEGAAGLKQVTGALDELNHYSDQTIYNFSEMARNIGTFTAAGVTLNVATEAIKGIANLAAISGSSADQASTAMYQLSQAISSGKVSLEDWNSVVNAGMGGKVFQNALMETARIHGVAIDKMVKDEGSFRLTLQDGWLTGEILTETLSKFTGDLTAAQLKTMGYNQQQIAQILKMGQTAQDAATKVKTMSQLINTLQEAVGSGWAKTWQILFGDFDQAKELFTSLNDVIGSFISQSADSRNKVLSDWAELGGRTSLIYSIKNAFQAVLSVVVPIKQAFRQIFPATTGADLMRLTTAIRSFTENLAVSGVTGQKIQRTFAGIFSVLGIGIDIVKAVAHSLFGLFSGVGGGASSFLDVTAAIGDFLVNLRLSIQQGDLFTKIFDTIARVIKVPLALLRMFVDFLGQMTSKFDGDKAVSGVSSFVSKLTPLAKLGDAILTAWEKVPNIVAGMFNSFFPFAQKVGAFFKSLGSWIASSAKGINFTSLFAGLDATALAALLVSIIGVIRKFKNSVDVGNLFEPVTKSFEELSKTLSTMQNTLRATTLLQIALAVATLTIAVVALSKIDSQGLTRALVAITAMFTQLFASMAVFEKLIGVKDIPKLLAMGVALILIAAAIDVLSAAVKNLSSLDWKGLAKGLTGVGALLAMVILVTKFIPDKAGLVSAGLGILILAAGVKVLASAVQDLSGLSWTELEKGLAGVGGLLLALGLFTKFAEADKAGVLQGAGILLLAAGMKVLASAVKDFSGLSWKEIGRGLSAMGGGLALIAGALYLIPPTAVFSAAGVLIVAASLGLIGDAIKDMAKLSWKDMARGIAEMAGALTLISAALYLIPPSSLLSAAAILIVAVSLGIIGDALGKMAKMSWTEIAKSLTLLAASLTIIAAAMYVMEGAIPGAAALLIVAASLAIIAPVLVTFGNMSWEAIGKGLLMLAAALTIIGVAGLLIAPVVPALIGLGLAVALLGVGMLLAGAGLALFAIGLTALAVAGVAGTAALVALVAGLAGLIPLVMQKLGEGLIAFALVIATAGPAFTQAITVVLGAIITAIVTLTPKILDALFKLLNLMLNKLEDNVPVLQAKGFRILLSFLNGIKDNIGLVVDVAVQIAINFINAIARNLPGIINAGYNLIISFVEGLAKAIRSNSDRMNNAGYDLASAIIEGMIKGMASGGGRVAAAARDVASRALQAAKDFLGVKSPSREFKKVGEFTSMGLAIGIDNMANVVENSARNVGGSAMDALRESMAGVSDIVTGEMDLNPTITPVLDLSDVQKKSNDLAGMLSNASLGATYASAQSASAAYQTHAESNNLSDMQDGTPSLTFIQTNNSPKALNPTEIYRNTRSQLSQAKEALNAN